MEYIESNVHFTKESITVYEIGLYLVVPLNDVWIDEKGLKNIAHLKDIKEEETQT